MKNLKKICIVIIIITILSVLCGGECHALSIKFDPTTTLNKTLDDISTTPIMGVLQLIFAVAQVGVTGVLVIHLTWVGIQYFLSATANDKATNKNKLLWAIIRILVWFIAMTLIVGLFDSLAG
jgi:hypothetical protein